MFLWPILITILSSITVIIFIESTQIIDIWKWTKECSKCSTKNEKKSKYCKNCGKKLKK
jgi:rRNA maturation endonuclease Nob1